MTCKASKDIYIHKESMPRLTARGLIERIDSHNQQPVPSPSIVSIITMSSIKPLTVWIHGEHGFTTAKSTTDESIGQGPNPFKVLITLEELGLPYETV